MTFTFNIISDEVENFKRVILVDSNATFMELKNAICDSVNYDKNQFCSFFLCEGNWEKTREITMEDMGSGSDEDVYLMDDCVLGDFIEDEGQRLIFNFDYLTDRSFFMEMKEMTPGKTLKDPLCSISRGTPPPQTVDFDEFNAKLDAQITSGADLDLGIDDEYFGEPSFNDDEFDESGFEVTDFTE